MDNYFKIEFCPDEFPSSDDEFDLELSIATPVSPVGQDAHGMWTPLGRGPDGAEHNSFSNHSQVNVPGDMLNSACAACIYTGKVTKDEEKRSEENALIQQSPIFFLACSLVCIHFPDI